MKTELQKQKDREYSRKYYYLHKKEVLAKQKVRNAAKKAVKDAFNVWPLPTTGISPSPKVQDVYVLNSWSEQLARIEKVLWWLAYAVSFVGVVILFK